MPRSKQNAAPKSSLDLNKKKILALMPRDAGDAALLIGKIVLASRRN
jgi:hypothetical protein